MKFSAIVEVRRAWAAAGIAEREGVTDADIRAFENRYGVRLPNDLAQYFKTVDGMNDGEYDDHPMHFWPLSKVRPVTAELSGADPVPYAGLFVFADYSLWAHGYAIRLVDVRANDVAIVGGAAPIWIASSFSEFLLAYARQPESLFGK